MCTSKQFSTGLCTLSTKHHIIYPHLNNKITVDTILNNYTTFSYIKKHLNEKYMLKLTKKIEVH